MAGQDKSAARSGMIDWDDAFSNLDYAPNAKELPARWARAAEQFRSKASAEGRFKADLAYGSGPREQLDLVLPDGNSKGLLLFVHGGYWRMFDKSTWTHLAEGCSARGWTVAVPSFPLAPDVRISDITTRIARAIDFAAAKVAGPVRLAGHSAGGHLVARMMCTGCLPEQVAARLARVVSISGLHQLGPLVETQMNKSLRLTETEANAESPVLCDPMKSVHLTAWVGAQERPEFLRQTRLIEEVWGLKGGDVSAVYDPGHNHFTVIEALCDAHSPLTDEILR